MAQKLWGGRFGADGGVDPVMAHFNASLRFDRRLAQADVQGSIAYSRALALSGIVSAEEAAEMQRGLALVADEWEKDVFVPVESDEDIHTANERRLGELVGTHIAGKLHTGRSRNDQVATDVRLWLRDQIKDVLVPEVGKLVEVLVDRAEVESDVLLPGYTHLQRAQPIRWAHLLLSYAWYLRDDGDRLREVLSRVDRLPLGCGALAGNSFGVDRVQLQKDLGFSGIIGNSLVAVAERDFIVEFASWATLLMVHLSKISEDLIVYSTAEFGFVSLSETYSTGSSLMPHKKNPDSLELIRGKTGRVVGALNSLIVTMKGLPSTYNKDMQEDKEPLFDCIDTVTGCLSIMRGVVSTLKINPERMKNALSADLLATDLAEHLVHQGVPFRSAHEVVGKAVRLAEIRGVSMDKLSLEDLRELNPAFGDDVASVWDHMASANRRKAIGGTSAEAVTEQIRLLREWTKFSEIDEIQEKSGKSLLPDARFRTSCQRCFYGICRDLPALDRPRDSPTGPPAAREDPHRHTMQDQDVSHEQTDAQAQADLDPRQFEMLVADLLVPERRDTALSELTKRREEFEDLPLMLWNSYGVMAVLLQEIIQVYPSLQPPNLTVQDSNRVCSALALLQCVASHNDTRTLFLNAHIPLFLYPFLNTSSRQRSFEYLRLTSLGVIGALVRQHESRDVINFLLSTEIIPLCLRIMENGSELSKTVAIFIVQKILVDDMGLTYICQTYERFCAVTNVLTNMVQTLAQIQSIRLLKHVIRCYLRLSENPRAKETLRASFPEELRNDTFEKILADDETTSRCLVTLLQNIDN